jgi:hypothetical protein
MSQSINNNQQSYSTSSRNQSHTKGKSSEHASQQSATPSAQHTTNGFSQLNSATLQNLLKLIEGIINSLQSNKHQNHPPDSSRGKNITGTQGNDYLRGSRKDDIIKGRNGNDVLVGKQGNDTLLGGRGADVLKGGAGDDILKGGSGSDRLFGGSGNDNLRGGRGADVLKGGTGDDVLKGGSGSDRLLGGKGNDQLFGGHGWDFLNGGKGNDQLFGGAGNDVLTDNKGINRIDGGSGEDTLKFHGALGDYDVNYSNNEFVITHKQSGATNTVSNVESFQFSDDTLSADSLRQSIPTQIDQYYSVDGSNNNLAHPDYGKADGTFFRLLPQDSTREPGGSTEANLPSAREVSNAVSSQTGNTENDKGLSDMFWLWGQFLDHDINHTAVNESDGANINIPTGDPQFDPNASGDQSMVFNRSNASIDSTGNRQQTNDITALIDGSNVYGSDAETASELRSYEGGKLKTGADNLLPTRPGSNQFYAGDVRVNEHGGLTSMHTLWMREHNRVADQLAQQNPEWGDEKLYQEARSTVIAEIQAISYNEFIPELLGEQTLGAYQGYDAEVDPQISNAFATAAYRFGHSMLSPTLLRLGEDGKPIEQGNLSLRDAFFQPDRVKEAGIEPFLRGFSSQTAQALDPLVIDDVRNFLFGEPSQGGFDLAALNIQRGRDHGLPSYNDSREALGLERITSFDDPIFANDFGEKLAQVYSNPDEIDMWVGGLAEQPAGDSLVGETMGKIMTDQFERLRAGDRLWYENRYSGEKLEQLNNLKLSDIIQRNTDIQNIQDNVMVASSNSAQMSSKNRSSVGQNGTQGAQGASGKGAAADDIPTTMASQMQLTTDQTQRLIDAIQRGEFG